MPSVRTACAPTANACGACSRPHARIAVLPNEVTRVQILGAGALGGIGFTVSLFITQLAFTDVGRADSAKIAILAASLVAAGVGYSLLRLATRPAVRPT